MTTAAIRKKLINYLGDADDQRIKGLYLLLEQDIESNNDFILDDAQTKILE